MSILTSIFLAAVTPVYVTHNTVPGNTQTMTNIQEWAASIGSGGGTDGAAVTNIVNSIFPSNRVFAVDGGLLTAYAVNGATTNKIWQEARGYEMTNAVYTTDQYNISRWETRGIDGTVTTIALTDETAPAGVSIELPAEWRTEARDFCVYIFNAATNPAPLRLPSDVNIYSYYSPDTNALLASSVTALYFTEISRGTFLFVRNELVKVQEAAQ